MKLSKKGKSRIHEMIDCAFEAHPDDAKGVQVLAKKYLTECDDFELQPDDFQGMVCLTVEEAKAIHTILYNYVWEYAFELTDYDVKLPDDLLSRIKRVNSEYNGEYLRFYEGRIEQAEGKE